MSDEAALLEQINATVARIQGKTDELQQSINGKLHWLPSGLQDSVVAGWNKFCGLMADIWHALGDILGHLGSPATLYRTAGLWSTSVGGPVSEKVGTIDTGVLTVDDTWTGTAADAYRQLLPGQKAALAAVKTTFTDPIATGLSSLAKGIYIFWGALVAALAGLAAGIVGGLASSATILGLPATPFIIVAAALVAAAAIAAGERNLGTTASDLKTTLQEKLSESTAFPNGQWPPARLAG
jgi:uncharacterized protein YukE